jgi:hypothetical protein
MPAQAAQVFGPVTVDPGFTSTGEKTLLTMRTTLPAGGINVIIVSFVKNAALSTTARGTYRIYKGATLLYESKIDPEYFNYAGNLGKHVLLMAVDTSPAGNDTYYFKINITAPGLTTGLVHVQGIVIKTDDAVWGYNTTAVSIAAGETATVMSISTSFPANSKVALVAVAYVHPTTAGTQIINAGNIRLKSGGEIASSNQFNVSAYSSYYQAWVSLSYLDLPTSGSQTYSVELTNNTSVAFNCYAEVVAFTVSDGAFLDTGSVALTKDSQVTVGSLSTALTGDVAVIALAAAENTGAISVTAFNAGDVVLQKDNSTADQISNLVGWYLGASSGPDRSGVMPLFRLDSGVSNPSYQVKMTARASNINGEAKILAFILGIIVSVSDFGSGAEVIMVNVTAAVSDSGSGVDRVDMCKEALDLGAGAEYIDMLKEVLDSGIGYDYFTGGLSKYVDDSGTGVEYVDMSKEALDSGSAIELVNMAHEALDSGSGVDMIFSPRYNPLTDSGSGVETAAMQVLQSDAGAGVDISMVTSIIPVLDSGSGVDIVTQVAKEVIDSGAGVEAVYISASVAAYDYGIGRRGNRHSCTDIS